MSEMIAEVYDEPWKRRIEKELGEIRTEIVELRGAPKLHNWMIAANIALTAAILFKLPST